MTAHSLSHSVLYASSDVHVSLLYYMRLATRLLGLSSFRLSGFSVCWTCCLLCQFIDVRAPPPVSGSCRGPLGSAGRLSRPLRLTRSDSSSAAGDTSSNFAIHATKSCVVCRSFSTGVILAVLSMLLQKTECINTPDEYTLTFT